MPAPQSYQNHSRRDPVFLFVILVLLLNVIATVWWYCRHFSEHKHIGAWLIVVSIALFLLAGMVRSYSLKVQDRVICMEERLRIASLVTASELIELSSLNNGQLVGLRFASDVELPQLARRAVRENLTRKQIKESIVSWRPDNHRV